MPYSKNIAFTRTLKVRGRWREFNFRRKGMGSHAVYEIDVSDENGLRHYFVASLVENTWTLEGDILPSWIKEQEKLLHESIADGELKAKSI